MKNYILFLTFLFSVLFFKQNLVAQNETIHTDSLNVVLKTYDKTLASLRIELNATVKKYIESFREAETSIKVSVDHIKELRSDLKEQVVTTLEKTPGGEALIAINRAKIELLIEEINAIEKTVGESKGKFTTPLNIFQEEYLTLLDNKIKAQLADIEKSLAKLPASETPLSLFMQKSELESWLREIQKEISIKRLGINEMPLKKIDQTLTEAHFKGYEALQQKFSTFGKEKRYLEKLMFEIELRLQHSPKDASLLSLKNNFQDVIGFKKTIPLSSISIRGPPSKWANPLQDVINEIRNAIFVEQEAIIVRDYVKIAHAKTNMLVYSKWLGLCVPDFNLNAPYEVLTIEELSYLKTNNIRWLFLLKNEHLVNNNTLVALEIQETELKLNSIETVIEQRQFGQTTDVKDLKLSQNNLSNLKKFEARLTQFEKYIRAKQLRLMVDNLIMTPNQSIKSAYYEQFNALKSIEQDMLLVVKGNTKNNTIIEQSINTLESIVANIKKIFIRNSNEVADYDITKSVQETKSQITHLDETISKLENSERNVIYQQAKSKSSVNEESFISKKSLKSGLTKYPVLFQNVFPKKESWVKNYKGLIKDIKKAPGGIIIDVSMTNNVNIQKAEFDVFSNEISVLIEGKQVVVDLSKDVNLIRQAWAYVNDERVAAIDLRPFSSEEIAWFINRVPKNDLLSSNTYIDLFSLVTTANIHPAFQNTAIGNDLVLADQVIFDLLPIDFNQIEGRYKIFENLGLNVGGLKKAYVADIHARNNPDINPRSIVKSIISIQAASLVLDKKIIINPKIDFAIYLIPNHKSAESYIKMEESSKWFNNNRNQLVSKLPELKRLNELSKIIAFFNTIKKTKIDNNFSALTYLMIEETKTPKFIYSGANEASLGQILKLMERKR